MSTIHTAQSGNWSDTTTWTGGVVPSSTDDVILDHSVTLDVDVTMEDGGSITFAGNPISFVIAASLTLNSGSVMIDTRGSVDIHGWLYLYGGEYQNYYTLIEAGSGAAIVLAYNSLFVNPHRISTTVSVLDHIRSMLDDSGAGIANAYCQVKYTVYETPANASQLAPREAMAFSGHQAVVDIEIRDEDGWLVDPDFIPDCALSRNGVLDTDAVVTVRKLSTGRYSFTWSTPNAYDVYYTAISYQVTGTETKCYTVPVTVTINPDIDVLSDRMDAIITGLASGIVTILSPVSPAGDTVTIIRGDDYTTAAAQPIDFGDPGTWPDLSGSTLTMTVKNSTGTVILSKSGTLTTAIDPDTEETYQVARFQPTHTDTNSLAPGSHRFDVQATLGDGTIRTIVAPGTFAVIEDITRPA